MQSGKSAYKCAKCTRRHRTSSNDKHDTEDDEVEHGPQFRASSESGASGSAPWEPSNFARLLLNMSAKLDVLTVEVKCLKAENTFLRSEIGVLNKRVLERLPLAAHPQASFAAAVLSPGPTAGWPPLSSGAVHRTTLDVSAAPGPINSSTRGVVPAVSAKGHGSRHDDRQAAAATDDDGFIPVIRKRRSPTSTGTAKSEKVRAVPRQPLIKALFVSRLDPNTSVSDIEDLITPSLEGKCVDITKLKPKFHSYSSFHIAGEQSAFDILNKSELWPEGSIFHQFFGKLDSSRVYEAESEAPVNA